MQNLNIVIFQCINLVGRQYIEKIHYFGRKLKEYDIMNLFKNRRSFEQSMMKHLPNFNMAEIEKYL